ncbi:MAG: ABC transporter ATP-binding protein, partial [Gaiellaceae bacterium]
RARILLARALLADSQLLVLDEPTAGLDLPGRELFRNAFENASRARPELATVSVSHHLEELSGVTSHALLLRDGGCVAAGPIAEAITDATLTQCFGLPLRVTRVDGRWTVSLTEPR